MKFKNLETGNIIEVNKNDIERIERLKGYPDKFEIVEVKEIKTEEVEEIKTETKKNNK